MWFKGYSSKGGRYKAFLQLLEMILNQVLKAQSKEQLGAAWYGRASGEFHIEMEVETGL